MLNTIVEENDSSSNNITPLQVPQRKPIINRLLIVFIVCAGLILLVSIFLTSYLIYQKSLMKKVNLSGNTQNISIFPSIEKTPTPESRLEQTPTTTSPTSSPSVILNPTEASKSRTFDIRLPIDLCRIRNATGLDITNKFNTFPETGLITHDHYLIPEDEYTFECTKLSEGAGGITVFADGRFLGTNWEGLSEGGKISLKVSNNLESIWVLNHEQISDLSFEIIKELPLESRVIGIVIKSPPQSQTIHFNFNGLALSMFPTNTLFEYQVRFGSKDEKNVYTTGQLKNDTRTINVITPVNWSQLNQGVVMSTQ